MKKINRRTFLKTTAAGLGAAGITLWLPRFARGDGPTGPVRHVILVNLVGGVRWQCNFGAASDVKLNPYGRLSWDLVPNDQKQHASTTGNPWPVGRVFQLRPANLRQMSFSQAYARLSSVDPADYNFNQPALKTWPGSSKLPSFCSIAHELASVYCDASPGGAALLDHAAGQQNLCTGATSGTVGLATLFGAALKGRTRMPAVAVNSPAYSLGTGKYTGSRPLSLISPTALPTSTPGQGRAGWARAHEQALDADLAQARQSFVSQAISNFALDKLQGDQNIKILVEDTLKLMTAPKSAAFGKTLDGSPVQNSMLAEVFGLSSADISPDDILFDAYRAMGQTSFTNNLFGLNAALATRFLQYGASVVACSVGAFDTHASELFTYPSQCIQVARMLTGLEFALKNIQDPDTGGPLWNTTVVVMGSEFGRQGLGIQPNGFNTGYGSDHSREQYFPMIGGPLKQKGQLLVDSGGNPYHMNSIWTAVLTGMGVDSDYLRADRYAPIPGLIG